MSRSLSSEVEEQRPKPGVGVLSDFLNAASLGRRGAGANSQQIRADEPILVPENGVQRRFRYTSSLDDAIDADGMHPFLIEEFVSGIHESLTR